MNLIKKCFLLLMIFASGLSYGQPDFKDVYKSLSENDRFSNIITLRAYQQQFPEHAVVYFLLSELYFEYVRETNPLTMLNFIEMNYRELKTNYGLAKFKLDESQARRDREYFGNIEITTTKKNVTLPDIVVEIDKRLSASEKYYNDAVSVHNNYIRCIEKYNQCLYKFREILKFFPNNKDLYLLLSDDISRDINSISADFDSMLVYFNSYKIACEKLPHLLKVNQYRLKPITTYRLEGLIEADFTLPVVELWDFKSWVVEFQRTVDADIAQIRKGMNEVDDGMNSQIERLKREEIYGDELTIFRPDDKFLNLIGKYDYSSLAKEFFEYKNAKIDYLASTRMMINNPTDSTDEYFKNRLLYFKELAYQKNELNGYVDELKKDVSLNKIGKYLNFFDSRYKGLDGLVRWCEVEKYDNDAILNQNLRHISLFYENDKDVKLEPDTLLMFGKNRISYAIQKPSFDSTWVDTLFTINKVDFKKQQFISGIKYGKNKSITSFIAKISETKKVEWFTETKIPVIDTISNLFPVHLSLLDDSVCITMNHVITTKNGQRTGLTFVEKTNWKGNKIQSIKLDNRGFPRYFYIDEINEQILIVTKGNNYSDDSRSRDTLTVLLTNFDVVTLWKNNFEIEGNFIDIIHTNSNFFMVCNATYLSKADQFGKNLLLSPQGFDNVVGFYINRDGEVKYCNNYYSKGALSVEIAQKITSNHLNMIGDFQDGNGHNEVFYLLTDQDGVPIISNCKYLTYNNIDY